MRYRMTYSVRGERPEYPLSSGSPRGYVRSWRKTPGWRLSVIVPRKLWRLHTTNTWYTIGIEEEKP